MGLGFLPNNFPKDIVFPPGDHRNRFPREVIHHWIDRANAVMKVLGLDDLNDTRSRAALALRFCISLPHTVSVIPGIMCPNDVIANAESVETGRLSDKEMSVALKCFLDWER
jgi:aryl-alcohol dehydrogenase-like predicted oxidoreductase